jgi:acyl-CoA synthetase (NDP forming)
MMMEKGLAGLEAIFRPRSVAVIGASDNPGKLGFHVMKSLTQGGYPGKIFPVNPGKSEILGIKTFVSLFDIPEEVELSVIVLPAEQVPKTIKECESRGVHAIILITAGFKEIEDKRGE